MQSLAATNEVCTMPVYRPLIGFDKQEIVEAVSYTHLTNGDTRLGGDDFDNKITQWMIDEFKKAEGVDLSTDKMALQRLSLIHI